MHRFRISILSFIVFGEYSGFGSAVAAAAVAVAAGAVAAAGVGGLDAVADGAATAGGFA